MRKKKKKKHFIGVTAALQFCLHRSTSQEIGIKPQFK